MSQGRIEEAETILRKAAKVNKVTLPEKIFDVDEAETPQKGQLWHLFTSRVLFFRTLIIFFNWYALFKWSFVLIYVQSLIIA